MDIWMTSIGPNGETTEPVNLGNQINTFDDEMTLVVEDDGKGFLVSETSMSGIGLGSIKSRVDLLGGFLDIASTPGDGTTVTINFPVHKGNGQRLED